jgi:hypothetical protein
VHVRLSRMENMASNSSSWPSMPDLVRTSPLLHPASSELTAPLELSLEYLSPVPVLYV